jgi:YD repeat-containing protein
VFDDIQEMFMKFGWFIAISTLAISVPLCAQTYIRPPESQQVDKNGVDLVSGWASLSVELGAIGSDIGRLAYSEHFQKGGGRGGLYMDMLRYQDDNNLKVYAILSEENSSKQFVSNPIFQPNGLFAVDRGSFETLTESADGKVFTRIRKNGQVDVYGIPPNETNQGGTYCTSNTNSSPAVQCGLVLLRSAFPNGVIWTYEWDSYVNNFAYTRPKSVTNNLGYKISLSYPYNANPVLNPVNPSQSTVGQWLFFNSVNFYNLAASSGPVYSASRSMGSYGLNLQTVGGENWSIGTDYEGAPIQVKTPSSSAPNWAFQGSDGGYPGTSRNLTFNGVSYTYNNVTNPASGVMTVTDPTGAVTKVNSTRFTSKVSKAAFPKSIIDPLNRTTTFDTVKAYLISAVTHPEGSKEVYGYDSRDNITSVTYRSKPGSGLPDLSETAEYPASCSNPITCNRPTLVRDKKGNATEYSYSPDHGGILTETQPPDVNGVRPVIRSNFTQRYAWIGNGAGGYQQAVSPVWVKSEERTCRTTATIGNACAGGSGDEKVTTFDYGSNAGPNNLNLRGAIITADGVTHRTCYGYDAAGRRISETKPMANLNSCP